MKESKGIQRAIRALALMPLLVTGSAWADWVPTPYNRFYAATVTVNGGSASITEQSNAYGPLYSAAGAATGVATQIQTGINDALRPRLQSAGASLLSGVVSGDLRVSLVSQPSGVASLEITGLDYRALSNFTGRLGGVLRYDCQNTLTLTNTRIAAQAAGLGGQVVQGSITASTTPSSSTWCDTDLSWLLPMIGDVIVNKVTGMVDTQIESAISGAAGNLNRTLLFANPLVNVRSGLQQMVPQSVVVRMSNGQDFRIGDYIWNNMAYIAANAQVTLKLGHYAPVDAVRGTQLPYGNVVTGVPLRMDVVVPGLSFSVELRDEAWVDWRWVCNVTRPGEFCEEP